MDFVHPQVSFSSVSLVIGVRWFRWVLCPYQGRDFFLQRLAHVEVSFWERFFLKLWLSFWCSFETTKKGVPENGSGFLFLGGCPFLVGFKVAPTINHQWVPREVFLFSEGTFLGSTKEIRRPALVGCQGKPSPREKGSGGGMLKTSVEGDVLFGDFPW